MSLSTADLKKYWDSANLLRKNLDAAEYKHIVLGLVFLKYVSDSFAERREELAQAFSDPASDRYKPDPKRLQAALDHSAWNLPICDLVQRPQTSNLSTLVVFWLQNVIRVEKSALG